MAQEGPKKVKAKVLKDHHLFSGIDEDGNAEVPEKLALTYRSLGVIELPEGWKPSTAKASAPASSSTPAKTSSASKKRTAAKTSTAKATTAASSTDASSAKESK